MKKLIAVGRRARRTPPGRPQANPLRMLAGPTPSVAPRIRTRGGGQNRLFVSNIGYWLLYL